MSGRVPTPSRCNQINVCASVVQNKAGYYVDVITSASVVYNGDFAQNINYVTWDYLNIFTDSFSLDYTVKAIVVRWREQSIDYSLSLRQT